VRYLSPEQVTGEIVGPKTDVYSLALILFEAATGTTPFDGVTAEIVLRSRINSPLPVRPELGTLDMLLAQAAVPDPLLRLDAEQFTNRLSTVLNDDGTLDRRSGANGRADSRAHHAARTSDVDRLSPAVGRPDRRQSAPACIPATGQFPHTARHAAPLSPRTARASSASCARAPDAATGSCRPTARRAIDDSGFLVAAIVDRGRRRGRSGGVETRAVLLEEDGAVAVGPQDPDAGDGAAQEPTGSPSPSTRRHHRRPWRQERDHDPEPGGGRQRQVGRGHHGAGIGWTEHGHAAHRSLFGETCAVATLRLHRLGVTATCPTTKEIASTHIATGRVARGPLPHNSNPVAVSRGSSVILELSSGPGPSSGTTTTTTSASGTTTTTTSTTTTTLAGQGLRAVPNVVGLNYSQTYAAMKKAVLYFTTTGPGAGTTTWTKVISESPGAGTMVPWQVERWSSNVQ
jgi:hypothetical protein